MQFYAIHLDCHCSLGETFKTTQFIKLHLKFMKLHLKDFL
jgi:hypothetical protein